MMEISSKLTGSYDPFTLGSPAEGDVLYFQDFDCPYLRLKVTTKSRSWVFDKSWTGRHIKRKIGKVSVIGLPEARRKANDWSAQLELGEDLPTTTERKHKALKTTMTVLDVWNLYCDKHLKKKASYKKATSAANMHLKSIHNVRLRDLTPLAIRNWMDKINEDAGPAMANKMFTHLSASLNYCGKMREITYDFTILETVDRFPDVERDAVLTRKDLERLLLVLENHSEVVRDIILILIYTMQRKSNVLQMKWRDLDLERQVWYVEGREMKARENTQVALTRQAVAILERRKQKQAGNEYVFPAGSKQSKTPYYSNINKPWLVIRRQAQLDPELTIHGIKHTGATWLADAGANPFVIQKVLNHKSLRISERYVKRASLKVLPALEALHEPSLRAVQG